MEHAPTVDHISTGHLASTTSPDDRPVQLTLEGLDPTAGIDPRFILDDETCRRGLRHIAAIRARLRGDADHRAA